MDALIQTQENIFVEESQIIKPSKTSFIEANTTKVNLDHLKNDCIIPVFTKDNETTISHYQFILETKEAIKELLDYQNEITPNIRVSHVIKGRVPSAIGKPAKELLEEEKTIYYERMAFTFEIPQINEQINGNKINLCIGGVRAYNQENLFSKKSMEKFKIFIGFQNTICTNLCVSTDGLKTDVRVSSVEELKKAILSLVNEYDRINHLKRMNEMINYSLNERQFAYLIGKMKLFQFIDKQRKSDLFPLKINDSQINSIIKEYYFDENFSQKDGKISLWKLYNLFTEANKNTYIDSNLERNVNAYEFINYLANSLKTCKSNYFLQL